MQIQKLVHNGMTFMKSVEREQTAEQVVEELNLFGDLNLLSFF